MIDRKELAEELLLRQNVRKAIRIVSEKKQLREHKNQNEENALRQLIRSLVLEGNAVATSSKHANTGINFLEDLLKNSNILSTLRAGYKSLTTDDQQRQSYRNHIEVFVKRSLAPEEERKRAGDIQEDINIEVDRPEDDPDFIDVEEDDRSDDEVDRDDATIAGADLTGRDRAYRDFKRIEKEILEVFDDLDNPEDSSLFEEYLIKNLSLYFDKFESELEPTVEPPQASLDAQAGAGGEEEVDDVAAIELQELIKHLDIDDIIENLL